MDKSQMICASNTLQCCNRLGLIQNEFKNADNSKIFFYN